MNTLHNDVFTYQPKNYSWITDAENSTTSCCDDQENRIDADS